MDCIEIACLEGIGVACLHGDVPFERLPEGFMRQLCRSSLAVSTVAAIVFATGASALTIDDFEEGDFALSDTNAAGVQTSEQTGLTTTSVVGGTRHVRLETVDGTGLQTATATLVTSVALDAVAISAPFSNTTVTPPQPGSQTVVTFIYDAIPNLTNDQSAGALGLDLSPFGILSFATTFGTPTPTGFIELTLWDADSSQITNGTLANGTSSILLDQSGNADLTDIRTLRVRIVSLRRDLSIGMISAIPEPGTGILVLAGIAALAAGRRERN